THSAHGALPVPPPAVVEVLRGLPVRLEDGAAELVTPTGAAIVAALARPEPVPELRIDAVGYGAGDRTLPDRPNLLRILVGEPAVAVGTDEVLVLEATIDDMSPQLYEHVLERLLAAGARDAFLVPVIMKRSRPATMLRVLAAPADRERLAGIVFAETSTIGLRYTSWRRMVLAREGRAGETAYGARPAYRDGEATLSDSSIICAYLERKHPEPPLYPAEPFEYARALWFEEYGDTALATILSGRLFFQKVMSPRFFNRAADEAACQKVV